MFLLPCQATIATVLDCSYRLVPSLIQERTNTRALVVPVARVPVGLKPEPKVRVKLETPEVRIITWRSSPAAGTVVVSVALPVGVTLTAELVPRAIAVVPLASAV